MLVRVRSKGAVGDGTRMGSSFWFCNGNDSNPPSPTVGPLPAVLFCLYSLYSC